jgi:glycosyltransferase involved in cell wall biosynthesis
VLCISDALPARNGVGTYYEDLTSQLGARLPAVELICPMPRGSGENRGLLLPLPGDKTQKLCIPSIGYFRRTFKRVNPDVVVVGTPGPFGMLGMFMASRAGLPACFGFHTQYDKLVDLYWNKAFGALSGWYLNRVDRILFRHSFAVLANSHMMADEAREMKAPNVQLVGTPLDSDFLAPVAQYAAGVKRAFYAGRFAPEKNVEAVLESAEACPEIHFVLAGDGPARPEVEACAERLPNLEYLGWLPRERLVEVLDTCDLLVMPSKVEAFGTVALEAMCRGKLVLATSGCGIVDWPDLAASIYVAEEAEAIPHAVKRISEDSPEEHERRARSGAEVARRINDTTLNQWIEVLESARSSKK